MKFPQKWIDIVNLITCHHLIDIPAQWGPDIGMHVIEALAKVGALKDPPKPREFWICAMCKIILTKKPQNKSEIITEECLAKKLNGITHLAHDFIHVLEVIDE